MSRTSTIELNADLEERLRARGNGDDPPGAIVAELLDEIEYLERVNDLATDGNWPRGEYY